MASVGILATGRPTSTSSWLTRFPRRASARPTSVRSRSNHECQMPPPYPTTPSIVDPAFSSLDTGLSFGHGESVCAPTTIAPLVVPSNAPPTANARSVDPFRVTK